MNYRIFIEKKVNFDIESQKITTELQLIYPKIICKQILIYDIFNITNDEFEKVKYSVFADTVTDILFDDFHLKYPNDVSYISSEYLAGQFDQRADSAEQAIAVITENTDVKIRTGKLFLFSNISTEQLYPLKKHLINSVDSQEKNLSILQYPETKKPQDIAILNGFIDFNKHKLQEFYTHEKFAFGFDDLEFIQDYFKTENRDPTETEIKVLDTYWSDHCRHTTFNTELKNIQFKGNYTQRLTEIYHDYLDKRNALGRNSKPITLMDLATISAKYLHKNGKLDNLVTSDEINACTINVEIEVDGKPQMWELLFKNETHNHPTEIEPFGGASTCIGGAIRDPLSGRAFVYQAMRISGSGNPLEEISETWEGKLPQRKITKEAANGYSSYGNQIGLATSFVSEIYDQGYKAKRMEVGMVVGAVPKNWIRREKPEKGDKIIVFGGKTGRDGVGGATGSSKVHTQESKDTLSAEVQKGDAVQERKMQRFFRNPNVLKLIKKSNDFGAGGVSVAIGEIADSISIDLNKLPTKYLGLNGTELAISESQERMAVVVENKDVQLFIQLAENENLVAVEVAEVTDNNRLQMFWNEKMIVDLDRNFLDSAGIQKSNDVTINSPNTEFPKIPKTLNQLNFIEELQSLNVCSQKGLIENFDSTVGQSTVLMPLGGKNQLTPTESSVHTFPVLKGKTNDVSIASFGFSPSISTWSQMHGGAFAVIESVAKIVASGGDYTKVRLSFQEYFEKLEKDSVKWGKPLASLLGAYEAQMQLELAAIGGKDSMSGTFKEISVPPTLISFAVATGKKEDIISPEFKEIGNYIYLIEHNPDEIGMPNFTQLKQNFNHIYQLIKEKKIISAKTIKEGGLACEIFKMCIGNDIGADINYETAYFTPKIGSFIIESEVEINQHNFIFLGKTTADNFIKINSHKFNLSELQKAWESTLEPVFNTKSEINELSKKDHEDRKENKVAQKTQNLILKTQNSIKICLPIFPGTNCEYETQKVFEDEGAIVNSFLIKNLNSRVLQESLIHFAKQIEQSKILVLSGGFSAGDEPDGSAKYMVSVLKNPLIREKIEKFLQNDGLILGICNGFQALVKSGLLPYGKIQNAEDNSPTLTYNKIGRHISQMATTKVISDKSPWLSGLKGKEFTIPFSHGEGRFFANESCQNELIENNQIATQYIDFEGNTANEMPFNPNGSVLGIEGISDISGRIFGKMGHNERFQNGLLKNIPNVEFMNIFKNGIDYFRTN